MGISKHLFDNLKDGTAIYLYKLINEHGAYVEILTLGGIVYSINVPDKYGKISDVALGLNSIDEYLKQGPYMGALIGRYANRINKGKILLNSVPIQLATNSNGHHLHGGNIGYDKKIWDATINDESLELKYTSPDGEENYPGNLQVTVVYRFTDDNELYINYKAICDKDTIINMTNHTYFNLAGSNCGDILSHKLMLNADYYTIIDDEAIPTGEQWPVDNTNFDFRIGAIIGDRLAKEDSDSQLKYGKGFDHNWIIAKKTSGIEKAAQISENSSGRIMEVFTDKPGIQFYSGNYLDDSVVGKNGCFYQKRDGLCLETQFYPDSINHSEWPSPILKAGDLYNYTTIYKFSVK